MELPKYSVLMSLYYKEDPEYLCQSIESMIHQTVKPSEIVIVKDGPLTDDLNKTLQIYQQTYPELINIVISEKNIGLGSALNLGLKYCRNELVARMDTDDISLTDRCEKQLIAFVKNPELSIIGTYINEFFDNPNDILSTRKVPTNQVDIYKFAKRRSPFNHPTVMYKKSKVSECGGYSNLKRNQDVDLFGRMLFQGCKAKNINEALVLFRSNNDLSRRRKSWQNTKSYIYTIFKFWKMGYSGFFDLIIVTIGQLIMFIMPIKVQNLKIGRAHV